MASSRGIIIFVPVAPWRRVTPLHRCKAPMRCDYASLSTKTSHTHVTFYVFAHFNGEGAREASRHLAHWTQVIRHSLKHKYFVNLQMSR